MSVNKGVNFFRIRCTNLVNLSSSLVISVDRPSENPCSDSSHEAGTLSERYSFFWKYCMSSISPRLAPPEPTEDEFDKSMTVKGKKK